jgi:hypothetical protein
MTDSGGFRARGFPPGCTSTSPRPARATPTQRTDRDSAFWSATERSSPFSRVRCLATARNRARPEKRRDRRCAEQDWQRLLVASVLRAETLSLQQLARDGSMLEGSDESAPQRGEVLVKPGACFILALGLCEQASLPRMTLDDLAPEVAFEKLKFPRLRLNRVAVGSKRFQHREVAFPVTSFDLEIHAKLV